MPEVGLEEEVQLQQSFPVVGGVGHVHVVAGADHARMNLIGGMLVAVGHLHGGVGVGPDGIPVDHRELLIAGDAVVDVQREALERGKGEVRGRQHGGGAGLGGPGHGCTALAAGGVDGAHHGGRGHDGAAVLGGVAVLLDGQAVVDAGVRQTGVVTGGPVDAGILDQLRIQVADLADLLGGEALQIVSPELPHGVALMRGAILQLDFELAVQGGVNQRVELGDVEDVAGDLGIVVAQAGHVLQPGLGEVRALPVFALPVGAADFGVGLIVGPAAVQLVVHEVAHGVAVAFDLPIHGVRSHIGLGEQAGVELVRIAAVQNAGGVAGGLHVGNDDHRGVGPLLDEGPVAQVVLQQHVAPAQSQRVVGAGAQRQPVLRVTAEVGQARVDADVGVGGAGNVNDRTAGVVVVGLGLFRGPLHELRGVVDDLGPGPSLHVVDTGCEVARALAHLVGGHDVRRAEMRERHAGVGLHAPLTAGAAPRERGLTAVLVGDLQNLVCDRLIGFFPGDAHPTGVVVALRVRALHGILDAVGVIRGLDGSLALGAMVAHGQEAVRVAFGADDLTILHEDPCTAFDLAATTAARADTSDGGPLG